jgi:hypothetical protein
LLAAFLVVFAGNGVVAAGEEGEEGRKLFRISPVAGLFAAARGRRAATAPQCLRTSCAVPGYFRDLFVIVTCLNVYLISCEMYFLAYVVL